MKSLKGQLIAAIAMTLVAIVTISSSTYAWFSMNTAVTASGMSVKAKTSGGLAIASYTTAGQAPDSTAFASTAEAQYLASATVAPTSFSGSKWYTAEAANANGYAAKAGTYTEVDSDKLGDYALLSKFQIKSMDTASDTTPVNLYVKGISVSAAGGSAELNKSMRLLVSLTDAGGAATYYYFAPMYTSVSGDKLYFYNGTKRDEKAVGTQIYINNNSGAYTTQIITATSSSGLTTTPKDVFVYVYYEGEDESCKSINAVNIDTLSVSITFATQLS